MPSINSETENQEQNGQKSDGFSRPVLKRKKTYKDRKSRAKKTAPPEDVKQHMRRLFHNDNLSIYAIASRLGYLVATVKTVTRYKPSPNTSIDSTKYSSVFAKKVAVEPIAIPESPTLSTEDVRTLLAKYPISYVATRTKLSYKTLEALTKNSLLTLEEAIVLTKKVSVRDEIDPTSGKINWSNICKRIYKGYDKAKMAHELQVPITDVTTRYYHFLRRLDETRTFAHTIDEENRETIVKMHRKGFTAARIQRELERFPLPRIKAVILHFT